MKPVPIARVLQTLPQSDLKGMFEDSPTEFLESLSDALTDILAERNALNLELAMLLHDRASKTGQMFHEES